MINGAHITLFTPEADELRAFLKDKLGFHAIDAGEGWLIFDMPRTELGVHPFSEDEAPPGHTRGTNFQEVSFTCDDIQKTVEELKGRGVQFVSDVVDEGYGLVARFLAPGVGEMMLYQPTY